MKGPLTGKVFVDVGAYTGDTVAWVLPYEGWSVYALEPAHRAYAELERTYGADPRVQCFNFGLWNKSDRGVLHGAGQGATLLDDYHPTFTGPVANGETEWARFVSASQFFRNELAGASEVVLKINCEGVECDILEDLMATEQMKRVKFALVDWDSKKSESQRHRQFDVLRRNVEGGFSQIITFEGPEFIRKAILREVLSR